ncbi:MAG: family 16 glycosylhydrolase [Gammaproteobacteria bacterium]
MKIIRCPVVSSVILYSLLTTGCKVANNADANRTSVSVQSSSHFISTDKQPAGNNATAQVPAANSQSDRQARRTGQSVNIAGQSNNRPQPPLPGNWSMVFEDDFSGGSLDPARWRLSGHHLGIVGIGGNSSQNVIVRDGKVELIAEKRSMVFASKAYDYAGAEITTFQKFRQAYGYFEARIKYDVEHGVWPAFWLMPDRGDYGKKEHQRESLMRFQLGDYSQPVASAILKVRVTGVERLRGHERQRNKTNYNLSVHGLLSDDWDEATVTWNTRPAFDPLWLQQFSSSENGANLVNDIVPGQDLEVDVTDYVNARIAAGKSAGFALTDTFRKQKQIVLGSKESANYSDQPRLEIDGNILTPTDDAYVRAGNEFADRNYGDLAELKVKTPWKNTSAVDKGGMEIDVMESLGIWGGDQTQHAMHWDYYGPGHPNTHSPRISQDVSDDGYHTYAMNWQPGRIDFYVDGEKTWSYTGGRVSRVASYLLLSQQLGGWDRNADIPDGFQAATMYVDYVRVWSGS